MGVHVVGVVDDKKRAAEQCSGVECETLKIVNCQKFFK